MKPLATEPSYKSTMSRIENKVMASVLLIHTARRALSFTAFKAYVAGVSLGTIAYLVSLPNVLRNLSHVGVDGFATFFSAANRPTYNTLTPSPLAGEGWGEEVLNFSTSIGVG